MIRFLHHVRISETEATASTDYEDMLCFDPSRVVQAITFHLLDEERAVAVDADSCADAIAKLSTRFGNLTISVDKWSVMENDERLRWLLDKSEIGVRMSSARCAALMAR